MKLKDLTPNRRNPRKNTDVKREMLRKSLEEFGDLSGVVFNVRDEQLIGGHQRRDVLPPDSDIVIMQRYDPPTRTGTVAEGHVLIAGEKHKYREVDWDKTKADAAMIAANKHGGEWDFQILNEVMLELDQSNYDMDLTGFDDMEIEDQMTFVSGHERRLNIDEVNRGDETSEWVGDVPDFQPGEKEIRLTIVFPTEEARKSFAETHKLEIHSTHSNQWLSRQI